MVKIVVKTFTTLTFLHYVYNKLAEITLKTTKNQSFQTGSLWNDSKTNTIPGYRFAVEPFVLRIGALGANDSGWVQNWLGGCNTELSFSLSF